MPKSILYKMYAADTIKLVKATLEGTTKPMVTFKIDPLEFCQEAHKVKDELISRAVELLETDIPITKQGDGWISAKERMPEIDQKVLVWARIRAPIEEETGFPFILVYEGGGLTESFGLEGNIATVSHWMPLPEPPTQENK